MESATKSALRVVRCVGVPLVIVSIIPTRPYHDWSLVQYAIFGVFACVPYSQLRSKSVFWSLFSIYALTTVAVVAGNVALWVRSGYWVAGDVVAIFLMLNIIVQPVCILALRHYRRIVPKSPEPSAVDAGISAARPTTMVGGGSGHGR